MANEPLKIKRKGEDGHRVITIRIREDTLESIDKIAAEANYSRNELINRMLEHGLDRDSAEVLVDHILMDMEMCDGCEIEDAWWMESCSCGLKMLMLIASYPTILNESTYLQNCVALEKNDAQMLPQFRNWNDFDYHIDLSTCTNISHGLRDATLTIRDPKSKKTVWTLSI